MNQALSLQTGRLILKTGEVFAGKVPLQQSDVYYGEVVFNTGMTGYIETLTDPSYAGQLLCFSYPLIGNYGVTDLTTWESKKIQVAGVIVSELSENPTHYGSTQSLREWLLEQNIPFIIGVDTRQLIHRLRETGVVMGALSTTALTTQQHHRLQTMQVLNETQLASRVSITEPEVYGEKSSHQKTIIVVDCGLKTNTIRCLTQFGWRIKRVPFDYDYTQEPFDGLLLSNGPGDPTLYKPTIAVLQKAMALGTKPIFGICLGSQLMALAAKANTKKLAVGHRAQNQPCLCIPENRAYLTSQNHGYAIEETSLPSTWKVLYRNLNDGSVAGIIHQYLPFFSVQFHPEAAPGPLDTQYLFEKFFQLVEGATISDLFNK